MLKRSPLKKVGKIGQINQEANRILKAKFVKMQTTSCEIKLPGCMKTFALSFAHRHKRLWYRSQPELLSEISQVVLACAYCHDKIERDPELTERTFKRLRGSEEQI